MKFSPSFLKAYLATAVALVLSFSSCKDDEHEHGNTAVITFTSPAANSTYHQGDTVHVTGSAIGQEELHGYELYILNKTSGDTVFTADEHAHGDTVQIHHEWVVNVAAASDMELGITVTLDHDNNTQTEKVGFHCMP
jgi:hypothetical protein